MALPLQHKHKTLFAIAIAGALGGPARAADAGAVVEIAPMLVTASRFEASIDTAPVNILTITAQEIADSGANSVSDVLRYQAAASVSSLFGINGARDRVDLGGFGENGGSNTLILLNGRRLNDLDLQGVNLAAIPLQSIERIEIVQGSASVLYGDNAVSGVVNIVTKSALDGEAANASVQYGSFQTRRLRANLRQMAGDTALSLSLDGLKSDGYRDNNQQQDLSLLGEASRELGTAIAGLRLSANRETLELPGPLNEPAYQDDPTQANSHDKTREHRYTTELFIEGERYAAELALRNKHQELHSPDDYGGVFDSEGDLRTLSFTPRVKRQLWNHALIAGVDAYRSRLDAGATYRSPSFNSDNNQQVTQTSTAVYLADAINLTGRTILNLGLRRQLVQVKADEVASGNDRRSDGINLWDASLSHRQHDGATHYVRIAKSFRSPLLDEMWNYNTGTLSLIKPQTGRHFEIGSRMRYANGLRTSISLFRMQLEDEIAYDLAGFANVNLEKTRHDGLDWQMRLPVGKQFSLQAAYAWRHATYRDGPNDGKAVPLVPRSRFTLGQQYAFSADSHLGVDVIYTGSRYFGNDDANAGKKMAPYTRVDLNYRHDFGRWYARLLVHNLTDVKTADSGFYRSYQPNPYYDYPLPERALYLQLGASF